MKAVLILTAGFGEGHNAAARNLREALLAASPDTNVVVADVFLDAYGWFNQLTQRGYVAMINHAPLIWQGVFELLHRTTLVEMHIGIYGAAAKRLEQLVTELKPEVIVSAYPGCNHLLDYVYRRRLVRPFRTVTIVTDSITVNAVWHRAFADTFIVGNEKTGAVMREAGVPANKIQVLGFPVPRIFSHLNVNRPVPPADGLWRVLYVINSGRQHAPGIVRKLLKLENIFLSVTVGRDEDLGRRLAAVAKSAGKTMEIHGWTPELPRLMADHHLLISKAGGATVQETLAAKTPMIITQIVPGQEEGNARLILESGAGALATTAPAISGAVAEAFCNDASLWRSWHQATESLSRPGASDEIAKFILQASG